MINRNTLLQGTKGIAQTLCYAKLPIPKTLNINYEKTSLAILHNGLQPYAGCFSQLALRLLLALVALRGIKMNINNLK